MAQARRTLDASAFALMLAICAEVSFVIQAAIRSIIATALLFAWARLRGIALFQRDGAFGPGIAAGLLFAAEFVFIYGGLAR